MGYIPVGAIFAATRAMAPTGMYPIVSDNWELELPHGVQPVDGVEGARLAVRQQVAHGADWIKFYRDRKSTRLNSSHLVISYAVFCLKKKKKQTRSSAREW